MKDLSHIKRIDFVEKIGPYSMNKVALFNDENTYETEVLYYIKNIYPHPDDTSSIIVLDEKEFNNVFGE